MTDNYTPLKSLHNLDQKIKIDYREFLSNFFLLIFFLSTSAIFIYSLFLKNPVPDKAQVNQNQTTGKKIDSFKYRQVEEIPFVIKIISNVNTNGENYLTQLKAINQTTEEKNLITEINRQIFTYFSLAKVFNEHPQFPPNYQSLIEANNQYLSTYQQNVIKFSGYYLKLRFSGYYGARKDEVNNFFQGKNLREIANEKISNIVNQKTDPQTLFSQLNEDEEIKQLNNGEKAIDFFEDNSFDFPLFDDPNFYEYLFSAPVNDYSNIFVLKTKNPLSTDFEEYAYLVFYLTKKEGRNLPVNYLIQKTLNEETYR